MRAALVAPAVAVQFLTIIPVRLPRSLPEGSFPGAVALFPLVGVLVGVLVGILGLLCELLLPTSVVVAIDLAFLAVLTGGLHFDGLADAADGLLGNLRPERRLAVMREGSIGAFGVLALVLVLLVEYAGLASLTPAMRVAALVTAAALARWSMSLLLWAFPYARAVGTGSAFKSGLRPAHLLVATLSAGLIAGILFSAAGVLLILLTATVALFVGWLAVRRVGGCTGDVYGAAGELTFAATVAAISGLTR